MLLNFFERLFISSLSISSARFSEFDAENMVLLEIKVFGLASYLIKVTAHPSFKRLLNIKLLYIIKYKNRK